MEKYSRCYGLIRFSTLILFGKIFRVVLLLGTRKTYHLDSERGGKEEKKKKKERKKRKKEKKKRPKREKWISSLGPRSRSRHLVIYFPCLLTLSQYNACARITSTVATLSLSNSITSSDHKKFTQLLILLTTSRSIHLSYRGRKIKNYENRSRFR